ncbi:MAG: hypothetical protein K2N73_02320 [Lachnospiraceae bacterium]|nr:hypothetical protein [Lachnospiraceae bacterium]
MFFWMRRQKTVQNETDGKNQNKHKKGGVLLSVMLVISVIKASVLKRMSAHSLRACLINYFCHLHNAATAPYSPLCVGFAPNSVDATLIWHKSSTNCDPHLAKSIFQTRSSRPVKASMTVEACFVLPFFLFAFLNIMSIVELYRLQGNMSLAMHETAKQMAVYGYEYKELEGDPAFTYLYAAAKVRAKLGTGYLDNAPLAKGVSSISWQHSSIMCGDDIIDLVAEYCIVPPVAVVGYPERVLYNRMRTRAWTGYDNAGSSAGETGREEIVYITPEGSVYHRSRACSYLRLSISAVDMDFLDSRRNHDGEKYYACEECGSSSGNTVYITNYGNRYHATLGCSRLTRTILAVPISECGGRGACSKCAKKSGEK